MWQASGLRENQKLLGRLNTKSRFMFVESDSSHRPFLPYRKNELDDVFQFREPVNVVFEFQINIRRRRSFGFN